jgi:hypothetical protein
MSGDCSIYEISDKLVLTYAPETMLELELRSIASFKFETPADAKREGGIDLSIYTSWLSVELPAGLVLILAEKAKAG